MRFFGTPLGLVLAASGTFLALRFLMARIRPAMASSEVSTMPTDKPPPSPQTPPKAEQGLFSNLASDLESGLADKPQAPTPKGAFRSKLEHVVLHPAGGFIQWQGTTVTALPLWDLANGLYARCSYDDSLIVAQKFGAKLLTWDQFAYIAQHGFIIEPCIQQAGPKMASREWCEKHDKCVRERLAASGYDGSKPVSNVGKQWLREPVGANHGWWVRRVQGKDASGNPAIVKRWDDGIPGDRSNLVPIQNAGLAHVAEKAHYTDYSQLLMLVK